jgi:hypothetical protein
MSVATPASAAAPAQTDLGGVWCASASNCVAVGGSGETSTDSSHARPLAERWNGKAWLTVAVRLPAGASVGDLFRLTCLSATWCVATGFYAKGGLYHLLAEFWNGKAWTPTEPPAPGGVGAVDNHLTGVSCLSVRNCVAVGSYDTGSGTVGVIEKWNGAKWTRLTSALGAGLSDLTEVSCPSAKFCVAVGTTGGVLVESWHGTAWRRVSAPSPVPPGGIAVLIGVSCASPSSCVAVGEAEGPGSGFAITETWNGKAWTRARVPWPKTVTQTQLYDVSCASRTYCVAVGNTGQNPASPLNAGRAAAVVWNGRAWAVQPVPAPPRGKADIFFGVSCRSAANCAAVGLTGPVGAKSGRSLSGVWNGKAWKLVPAI